MDEYKCPECGQPLLRVRRSASSPLNEEQFDAVKAGDYVCEVCRGTRGKSGMRYYWKHEIEAEMPTTEEEDDTAALKAELERVRAMSERRRKALKEHVLECAYWKEFTEDLKVIRDDLNKKVEEKLDALKKAFTYGDATNTHLDILDWLYEHGIPKEEYSTWGRNRAIVREEG
jgi:hypothetical protein